MQEGITSTSIQAVTITAPVNTITTTSAAVATSGNSTSGSSSGLSSSAKTGIGAGVGAGGGLALLGLLAFLLWRRRKSRVGDDFKWPELGDGTGSGATAAGLYPNPTHPTGNNRFDMEDDELFDGQGSTTGASNGNGMMSERDPSFLSSAAGTAGGGYSNAYGGMAGLGAGAGVATGAAGLGGAATASSLGHNRYGTQSDLGDYYSQEGHGPNGYSPERSPQGSQFTHNGGGQQAGYQNYQYDPSGGQHHFYGQGGVAGLPAGAAAAGLGAGVAGDRLSRAGSIASTTAGGYQVGAIPEYDEEQGNRPRQGRNRLSVVNALGDVGEE